MANAFATYGANLDRYSDFLKVYYLPEIRVLINKASALLFRMEKDSTSIVGKNATIALQLGLLPAYSRGEGEEIPAGGTIPKETAEVALRYHYVPIYFSNILREASRSNPGAFISVLSAHTRGAVDTLRRNLNMQCALDNDGKLTDVAATAIADGTYTTGSLGTLVVDSTQHMWPGQVLDVLADGTTTKRSTAGLTVQSVVNSTTALVTGTIASAAVGDDVYIFGNKSNQMGGLRDVFGQGAGTSYLGVERDDHAEWKAQYNDVSGAISLNDIQTVLDDAEHKMMGHITVGFCSPGVKRAYMALLTPDRRYNYPQTLKLDGGFTGVAYTGGTTEIPIIAERDILKNKLYLLDESTFTMFMLKDFDWVPGPDNGVLHPLVINGYDAVKAMLYGYMNMGCANPGKNGLLDNLTEA